MDITFPPTVFIALGVVTAALLTGFFSYMNMVSSKENKVSEFRLSWLDGLRTEIAEYTSAVQELVRVRGRFNGQNYHSAKEVHELDIQWYKETREAFARAVESMSKIQLRLNPQHALEKPDSPEAQLLNVVMAARSATKDGDFQKALDICHDIRVAAAPILKSTWNLVKDGEPGYRRTRKYAALTVAGGFYLILTVGVAMALAKVLASNQNDLPVMIVPQSEAPAAIQNTPPHDSPTVVIPKDKVPEPQAPH